MAELSESAVEQAAGFLADRLIEVYQTEQIKAMVDEFSQAGFTRESLIGDPDALYRMIVVASYDRRPFTRGAGGYETIWELEVGSIGVPTLMARTGLWSIVEVEALSDSTIQAKLSHLYLGGLPMDSDGDTTNYVDTLRVITTYANSGFIKRLQRTRTATEIRAIYQTFIGIHGIGSTISSKLVKYLLREIRIGQALPTDFPRDVAWTIVSEWHANKAADKFHLLNPNLVPQTAIALERRGDAYAIDALFYLQRNRPWELDDLIKNLKAL